MATIVRTTPSDQTTFGPVPLSALPSGTIRVAVADIDDPSTELGALSSTAGQLLVAYNGDDFTLYAWTASSVEDIPLVVAGSSGYWVAISGFVLSSGSGGGSDPGGADTQVQFNDGGVFGGQAGFAFTKATGTLSVAGAPTADTHVVRKADLVTYWPIGYWPAGYWP